MKVLYSDEHHNCYNYATEKPPIEYLHLKQGTTYSMNTIDNKTLILKSGYLTLSYGKHIDKKLKSNQMIVIPSGFALSSKVLTDSEVLVFRIRGISDLCERFALEQLLLEKTKKISGLEIKETDILISNTSINEYMINLLKHVEAGLKCSYFLDLKIK